MIGGGPFLSFYNSKTEAISPSTEYIRDSESKENGHTFGLDIILGVEYSLVENLILSGESGIYVGINNSKYEKNEKIIYEDENLDKTSKVTSDRNKLSIDDISVNLGLSIFF